MGKAKTILASFSIVLAPYSRKEESAKNTKSNLNLLILVLIFLTIKSLIFKPAKTLRPGFGKKAKIWRKKKKNRFLLKKPVFIKKNVF